MRNIIFGINLTADGCCDHTKGRPDEDVHEYFTNLIRETDLLVYGRKTYQLMVPFWPDMAKNNSGTTKAMNDFAHAFDAVEKIVFSTTLEDNQGPRTKVIRTNLKEEILTLQQQPGGNILIGGVDLPSQLMKLGLINEFRVVIQPVVAGEGRRLWDNVSIESLPLKLVESKIFKSGSVALRYVKE